MGQLAALDPSDVLARELEAAGFGVIDGWLSPAARDALATEADALLADRHMRPAAIGRGRERAHRPEIRGDLITWLEEQPRTAAQSELFAALERLRVAINRTTYLGLLDYEGHFAAYPPGAGYGRHRDRLRSDDARVVSCVVYLNRAWRSEHGGVLRLFPDASAAPVDIEPLAGRAVVFLAGAMLHEVLPAHALRVSIAGWFRRRALAAGP